MRATYRVLAYLVAAGVVVQAGLIALAWFTALHDVENGTIIDSNYEGNFAHSAHGTNGMMILPLLAIVLFVVSFFAKFPGAVKFAAIVLGLVVLQVVLALVAFGVPAVGALHGMNALVILGVSIAAGLRVPGAGTVASPADTFA